MDDGLDESGEAGHGITERAARPPTTLGHGGVLGILLALPLAALTLVGLGRSLGPHPVPRTPPVTATLVDAATEWCFRTPPAGIPDRLSHGYRFLWFFSGSYGDHGQETTWVYNRSCADPDANYPVLVIRITDGDGQRDPRRGRQVDLDWSHATGTYYQGWMPRVLHTLLCTGGYWFPDEKVRCRWDAATVNLLMVNAPKETYAIIGGRVDGIGQDELVAIANRLSGAPASG